MLDKEIEVIKKFYDGNKVESEEEFKILEELSKTGLVRFSFTFKDKEIYASLTELGRKVFDRYK